MAASITAPDKRRPARNPLGLTTMSLMKRYKKTPALAEGQDGL
ncbi:hypothetical protein T8K17_23050 [Thalassobaculum sp. OXR-137]|nr:hypothetical protein [Thalassobaculum sp. OXR-137]WPZ34103.1 hypothetical protein T8K17_23050 [Thalassobaculum sp. OXR-137]